MLCAWRAGYNRRGLQQLVTHTSSPMPDSTLQEIKDRLNVVDVISAYIPVKKAGSNFRAICPFHHEKTGSLMISPAKQIWHCFGCQEGGDIFGFVMRYENIEFREALKILADKAGVKLPQYTSANQQVTDEKELLMRINAFAAKFYQEILWKNPRGAEALAYLKKRGLTEETIKQWQIGFAPNEFHLLEQALTKKNVPLDALVKAGVSGKNERGQLYDRFRGRITFPILNYYGEVVGFSARTLEEKDATGRPLAKYVNSPETVIYNKSRVVFGLNFAKTEIRKKDEVIIVEGQMDCIAAHQAGFTNVVASSGTAFTLDQVTLLGRLTKNLKFCFDADPAGLAATKRAVESYVGKEFIIKIVVIDGAKDPDELIQRNPKKFAEAVEQAPLFLDFYFDQAFKSFFGQVEQKKLISQELLPLVRRLSDPIEQDHYIQELAERFNTTPKVLREALSQVKPAAQATPIITAPEEKPAASGLTVQEKEILGGMLQFADFFEDLRGQIVIEDFETAEMQQIMQLLLAGNRAAVLEETVAKEALFMVESELDELGNEEDVLKRQLKKNFLMLKVQALKRRQSQMSEQIGRLQQESASGAEEKRQQLKIQMDFLNQQFAEVSRQRMQYESQL